MLGPPVARVLSSNRGLLAGAVAAEAPWESVVAATEPPAGGEAGRLLNQAQNNFLSLWWPQQLRRKAGQERRLVRMGV